MKDNRDAYRLVRRACFVFATACALTMSGCERKEQDPPPAPRNEHSPFASSRSLSGSTASAATPEPWRDLREVALGELFACGLDASSDVYCWGSGRFGQLGLGSSDEARSTLLPQGPLQNLPDVAQISANRGFACAVARVGSVWCWGNNVHGQLGDGTTENRFVPVLVRGVDGATEVDAGYQHACAVGEEGELWCWGENADGQLARAGGGRYLEPVRIAGIGRVRAVACGRATTCALREAGDVWCWGSNAYGELGRDLPPEELAGSASPARVSGLVSVAMIDGYADHFCAVRDGGELYCWGGEEMPPARELRRRAAREDAGMSVDPLPVIGDVERIDGVEDVAEVAVGSDFSCARQLSGQVYCWGDNAWAQLGSGSQAEREDPTPMARVTEATAIFAGARNSCVRSARSTMLCSGSNRGGEVGNGSNSIALTPTPVLRPARR